MTPAPKLQELIEIVRADAASDDPLAELGQAAQIAKDIEEVNDALLGHFVDRCRRSGRSWSEISAVLGVTRQAAHKRYAAPDLSGSPVLGRFTPRLLAVLEDASKEARAHGHHFLGTEHLLLALFNSEGSMAQQILREAGVDYAMIEERAIGAAARTDVPVEGETPYTLRATDALRLSLAEALQLGHSYVGTEHLLIALFGDPESVAAKTLAALSVSRDNVINALERKLGELRG